MTLRHYLVYGLAWWRAFFYYDWFPSFLRLPLSHLFLGQICGSISEYLDPDASLVGYAYDHFHGRT